MLFVNIPMDLYCYDIFQGAFVWSSKALVSEVSHQYLTLGIFLLYYSYHLYCPYHKTIMQYAVPVAVCGFHDMMCVHLLRTFVLPFDYDGILSQC